MIGDVDSGDADADNDGPDEDGDEAFLCNKATAKHPFLSSLFPSLLATAMTEDDGGW